MAVDGIGAVDEDVELFEEREVGDLEPERAGEVFGLLGGGNALDVEVLVADALGEGFDAPRGSASCAEPDLHAGLDHLDGGLREGV